MRFNTMDEIKELGETTVSSEIIFDGKVLHVYEDQIELPDKGRASREIIRHIGAVCIIPITDDGEVILERQFRYPINQVITEIPAGKLDYAEEDRLEAAKRELREETGYSAGKWIDMGIYYPAAAYSDEKITMFLATQLHKGEQDLDEDEFLHVFKAPISQVIDDILSGKITDGKTQTAVLKAAKILANM